LKKNKRAKKSIGEIITFKMLLTGRAEGRDFKLNHKKLARKFPGSGGVISPRGARKGPICHIRVDLMSQGR